MGALRLLLALSVVAWHTSGIRWLPLPTGDAAVEFFFVISGFYMALILNEKYIGQGSYRLFITNRFVRIYSVYFLMAGATFVLMLSAPIELNLLDPQWMSQFGTKAKTLIYGSNLAIFGLDSFGFLTIDHGALTLIRDAACEKAIAVDGLMIVPQAWTLGPELTFYLIAPLIVRRISRICALGVVSVLLRLVLWMHGFDSKAWNYNFFPTELVFFLMGALLYHGRRTSLFKRWGPMLATFAPYGTGLALFTFHGLPLALSYGAVILSIPFLFELTRRNRVDRWVGELSYPLYMVHFVVIFATQGFAPDFAQSGRFGSFVVITSLALSIAVWRYLVVPVDRWRDHATRKAKLAPRSGPEAAAA